MGAEEKKNFSALGQRSQQPEGLVPDHPLRGLKTPGMVPCRIRRRLYGRLLDTRPRRVSYHQLRQEVSN